MVRWWRMRRPGLSWTLLGGSSCNTWRLFGSRFLGACSCIWRSRDGCSEYQCTTFCTAVVYTLLQSGVLLRCHGSGCGYECRARRVRCTRQWCHSAVLTVSVYPSCGSAGVRGQLILLLLLSSARAYARLTNTINTHSLVRSPV